MFSAVAIVLASFTGASAALAEGAENVPVAAVVQAFVENCADLEAEANVLSALEANGWSPADIKGHDGLAAMTSLHSDREGYDLEAGAFAKPAVPHVFTMLSRTKAGGAHVLDCHVVTFEPTDDFRGKELAGLGAKAIPTKVIDEPGMHMAIWDPGLFPGHRETSISYLPVTSALRDHLPTPSPYIMILGRSPSRSDGAAVNSEERAE
ncbi:hypothetical protein [Pontixanthobacter luteolus]|uniref:hypothetical protein n=1 Tax=Pontixanthobacter luteolus TaxID=295089 RepID=UPI002302DC40|nr:hypothetical protein [Pontixanthobacter luteolus]